MRRWLLVCAVALWAGEAGAEGLLGWLKGAPPERVEIELSIYDTPTLMEAEITRPVEAAVAAIEGVIAVESLTSTQTWRVVVTVTRGDALAEIREAVSRVVGDAEMDLPFTVRRAQPDPSAWWVMTGEDAVARYEGLRRLARGGEPCAGGERVEIRLDTRRAEALGLGLDAVESPLRRAIDGGRRLEDLGAVVVKGQDQRPIALRDVATIAAVEDADACRCWWMGRPAACVPAGEEAPQPMPPGVTAQRVEPSARGVALVGEGGALASARQDLFQEGLVTVKGDRLTAWPQKAASAALDGQQQARWIEAAERRPGLHVSPAGEGGERRRWAVSGGDLAARRRAAEAFAEAARDRGAGAAVAGQRLAPEIQLTLDREALRRLGISEAQVSEQLRDRQSGRRIGTLKGGRSVTLIAGEAPVGDVMALQQVMIKSRAGAQIPLSAVAQITLAAPPAALHRYDQRPVTWVETWGAEAKAALEAVRLPVGVVVQAVE